MLTLAASFVAVEQVVPEVAVNEHPSVAFVRQLVWLTARALCFNLPFDLSSDRIDFHPMVRK